MIRRRVGIICPKVDSYALRSDNEKYYIRCKVIEAIELYSNIYNEVKFEYFIEDELAHELVKYLDERIVVAPITAFNKMMRRMYATQVNPYEGYSDIKATICDEFVTRCSMESVKKSDKASVSAYLSRLLRSTVNEYLKTIDSVNIYFDANNQFCNLEEPKVGDCRLVHYVDLKLGISKFWYSGLDVDAETYKSILEGSLC